MMDQAIELQFPFVEALTVKRKSRLTKLWDHLAEVKAVVAEKGTLVPQHLVAKLLDLSKGRIGQLIDDGRLDAVEIDGVRYVTEKSVVAFARVERKNGRPVKVLDNAGIWKASKSSAREIVEKTSK